ncbi:hypothetical protein AWC38_SpisGene15848 [Stylophora pistillata]|uniref:Helix-turn-helix domain-containing protein n=1 Tax=Stylophora pistillata TaxID=50429 RepID=A0A2B4RSC8_STYPI|nr:hypothetical protein AWC38_SpisGene15848 [Stylophora pistillata]
MGSFDGAETCELVGCFLLSILTEKYGQNIGLYRDDGLAALNGTPQEIENIKKGFCKVFRDNDLKITVEANITKTNFLDVTLDLSSGKYYPFTKEGNIPLYVHKKSNHPPSILRNIPESINRRLSEISSDRECFDSAKPIYQEALKKSGYSYTLSFNAASNQAPRPRRNRQRNITWFNPPYSKNVETNVGKCFLALIDKHFTKTNPLHKIFNRNTLKLSYSCMGSIKTVISNHNKSEIRKLARANDRARKSCNCRKPDICPMDGNCNMESIIYQAEVTTETAKETYIGLCDTAFKMRYRNHLCSFRNERYRHATELSKYIWSLKDKDTKFNIKWRKAISKQQVEKLFQSGELGPADTKDPAQLQRTAWFYLCIYFGRRGRENQRDMKPAMLALRATAQGEEYYELNREFPGSLPTKTHQGGLSDTEDQSDGKIFAVPESAKCPVKTIKNYLSHLNPMLDCLFQRPREARSFNLARIKCGTTIGRSE